MTKKDANEFAQEYMAKQQKLADAAGMHVLEYMAQLDGGLLRPVIAKIIKHGQAHRDGCPADCAYEASLNRLKEKYSTA